MLIERVALRALAGEPPDLAFEVPALLAFAHLPEAAPPLSWLGEGEHVVWVAHDGTYTATVPGLFAGDPPQVQRSVAAYPIGTGDLLGTGRHTFGYVWGELRDLADDRSSWRSATCRVSL